MFFPKSSCTEVLFFSLENTFNWDPNLIIEFLEIWTYRFWFILWKIKHISLFVVVQGRGWGGAFDEKDKSKPWDRGLNLGCVLQSLRSSENLLTFGF